MLGPRIRQSITGTGPLSFILVDDATTTKTRSILTAYGSGNAGVFTIVDSSGLWSVVEGVAGAPSDFTVVRTIRNSSGTADNVTFPVGTKTILVGDCADVLTFLCQCPTSTGTATAYAVSYTPSVTGIVRNTVLRFRPHVTSGYGATLTDNRLGALPIRKGNGGVPIGDGDLVAGQVAEVMYDWGNGFFQLIGAQSAAFTGYRSENQVISPNTSTTILFDLESSDTSGWFDTTGIIGRFTPKVPGRYAFTGRATFTNCSVGTTALLSLYLNGTQAYRLDDRTSSKAARLSVGGSAVLTMNGSTDYAELRIEHDESVLGALAIQGAGGGAYTYFHGYRVA